MKFALVSLTIHSLWILVSSTICFYLRQLILFGFDSTGWPSVEFTAVDDEQFKSLYLMNDVKNYRFSRWVNNSVVKMVSTVHTGLEGEDIEANRRRPRLNPTNKNNFENVWGKEHRRKINIPLVINNYNHWMNGVDVSDQLIANYCRKLQCR